MKRHIPPHVIAGQQNLPLPRRFRRIVERVLARDADYFARNPAATAYRRDYVPGEAFPTFPPQGSTVRVERTGPGFRTRLIVPPGRDGAA